MTRKLYPSDVSDGEWAFGALATLGHLLAWQVMSANEQDRAQAVRLAAQVQEVTGDRLLQACNVLEKSPQLVALCLEHLLIDTGWNMGNRLAAGTAQRIRIAHGIVIPARN